MYNSSLQLVLLESDERLLATIVVLVVVLEISTQSKAILQ